MAVYFYIQVECYTNFSCACDAPALNMLKH